MKKKLVWKDTSNRVVLKSVVVGHFAMWAVRQSPYPEPEELVNGIEEFNEYLIPSGMAGREDFVETTYTELRDNIRNAITNSDIITSWGVAKKGADSVFISAHSEQKPDHDYISLDALARNIAQSVWLELFYNEGGFE
jgi:hypothetical protein